MANERDNFKAGLFVLLGVVLALGVVFALADFGRYFERRQTVLVSFTLSDGLQGLKEGAAVTLGDQPIGVVTEIDDVYEPGPGGTPRVVGKLAAVEIPQRYRLYQDAAVELIVQALGSGTRLNIRSVGTGEPYRPGDVIPGQIGPMVLTQSLARDWGIEDRQRQQVKEIIANVEAITATLREDLPELTATARRVIADAEPLAAEARGAVSDLRQAISNVRSITGDVRQRSALWLDRIDSLTGAADDTLARVSALLTETDPAIRESVENVRAITHKAREETLAQVNDALDKAVAALENVQTATQELRTFVVGQRPVLERAVANAALTADQLKLTAVEVRRSPWRLLYKPSEKELETDNLYDAARSFALAAGTLDAAARSLRAVSEDEKVDREQVEAMLDHLEALFGRFREAESAFWDALGGRTGRGRD